MQERYANKHRRSVPAIKVGDWILLRRKRADQTKLTPIADDSFKVLQVEMNNVTLKLWRNSQAYFMINISRIQLYFEPRSKLFIESSKNDIEDEYPVDRIIEHKI